MINFVKKSRKRIIMIRFVIFCHKKLITAYSILVIQPYNSD